MKNLLLLLTFISFTLFGQIPNSSFENMNSDSTIQFWSGCPYSISMNDSIISDGKFLSLSTNSHSGIYALELRNSWNYTQNYGYPGCAQTSSEITGQASFINTFESNIRPEFFEFYYLFTNLELDDTSMCSIYVRDTNFIEIGSGTFKMYEIANNYTLAHVPIYYTENYNSTVFVNIEFRNKTVYSNASLGTRLLIDDLSLSWISSLVEQENKGNLFVFPNPVADKISIPTIDGLSKIELHDDLGKNVLTQTGYSKYIDVEFLPSGVYTLKTSINNDIYTAKVIKYWIELIFSE